MKLEISRDQKGRVVVSNPATGKSEIVVTSVLRRPAEKTVADVADLPAHHWSNLV